MDLTILGLLPMAIGISFDFHKFVIQFGSESGQYFKPMAWSIMYGIDIRNRDHAHRGAVFPDSRVQALSAKGRG